MTRDKSYSVSNGSEYTIADFGGTGTLLCIHRIPGRQLSANVSIDKSVMAPVEIDSKWMVADGVSIMFDGDYIITTYKE